MKASVEMYKGIEFVRISSLPEVQKERIRNSFNTLKIIKILCGNELLHDCLQYEEYETWYNVQYKAVTVRESASQLTVALKLAFE